MRLLIFLTILAVADGPVAQEAFRQPWPLIVTVQFQGLSLPFRDLGRNARNVGLGIGTEIQFGPKGTILQRTTLSFYRNPTVGNGWLLQSQTVYKPSFGESGFAELRAGAGYLLSRRPSPGFALKAGEWKKVGRRGAGMWVVPAGVSVGFRPRDPNVQTYRLGYQVMVVSGYSRDIPVVPMTLLELGANLDLR